MSSSCNLKRFCYCFSLVWSFHTPIGYRQPGEVPKHQHSQTQTRISTITLNDLSQIMEKKNLHGGSHSAMIWILWPWNILTPEPQ